MNTAFNNHFPMNLLEEPNNQLLFRCKQCYSIPLIGINTDNDQIFIETKCENSHFEKIEINNYLQFQRINNLTCNICKNKTNNIYYCVNDYKFYCFNCKNLKKDFFKFLDLKEYDSKCKTHLKDYFSYCEICNKNKCLYCTCPHDNNPNYIHTSLIISKDNINKLKNNLNQLKDYIQTIYQKTQELYQEILKLLQNNIIEFNKKNNEIIKLCEKIISCYEYHDSSQSLNYQIINNVRNMFKFKNLNLKYQDYFNLDKILIVENSKLEKKNNIKENEKNLNDENTKKNNLRIGIINMIQNLIENNSKYKEIFQKNEILINSNKDNQNNNIIINKIISPPAITPQKNVITIKINDKSSDSSETEIIEKPYIKINYLETPLIIKLNTNEGNSEEIRKKISLEICKYSEKYIDKNILENIFKEYPEINFDNTNKKIVYNEYYEKDNYFYSGEINSKTRKREGRGITIYKNGDYRIGYFHNDKQVIKGIFYLNDQESYYEGEFINDLQDGYGELYWNDKEFFFGKFIQSEMFFGIFYYANGSIYKGSFKNGKKNGRGDYYDSKKKIWEIGLEFKNDIRCRK